MRPPHLRLPYLSASYVQFWVWEHLNLTYSLGEWPGVSDRPIDFVLRNDVILHYLYSCSFHSKVRGTRVAVIRRHSPAFPVIFRVYSSRFRQPALSQVTVSNTARLVSIIQLREAEHVPTALSFVSKPPTSMAS